VLIPFFWKWRKFIQNNQYWKSVRAEGVCCALGACLPCVRGRSHARGAGDAGASGRSGYGSSSGGSSQINLNTTLRQHWTENEILDVFYKYLGVRYTRFE
jgi:hypothetical protein